MHLVLVLSLYVCSGVPQFFLLILPLEKWMFAKSKKGGEEVSLLDVPRVKSAIKLLLCPNHALC